MKEIMAKIMEQADICDESGLHIQADELTKVAIRLALKADSWASRCKERLESSIIITRTADIDALKQEFEELVDIAEIMINGIRVAGNDIDGYYQFRKEAENMWGGDWRGPYPPYQSLVEQTKELIVKVIEYIEDNKLIKDGE